MTKAEAAVKAVAKDNAEAAAGASTTAANRGGEHAVSASQHVKPALPQGRHCSPNLSEFLISEDSLRSQLSMCTACLVRRRIAGKDAACKQHSRMLRHVCALCNELQVPQDGGFDPDSWLRSALIDAAVLGSDGVRLPD